MNNNSFETDELVIVGGRYGDLADKLTPLFEKGAPIDEKELEIITGGETLYLMKTANDHDPYAIGVFTPTMKRIGFLWMYQAYAMGEWMEANNEKCVRARISRLSTKYGFMISKPVKPMKLTFRPRESLYFDKDWASNLPKLMPCRKGEWLELSMMMLEDGLNDCDAWNEVMKSRIENVIDELPYDLSSLGYTKGMELYLKMKDSEIQQIRDESDRLLYTMIHRGSKQRMDWWMDSCLPYYFHDPGIGSVVDLFDSANMTLEHIEALLHQAPEHLFHFYLADRSNFSTHLLYSALPHELYTRLLTLLAVREAMMQRKEEVEQVESDVDEVMAEEMNDDVLIFQCIKQMDKEESLKYLYDYTWIMEVMNLTKGLPKFNTPSSFITYLKNNGIKRLPSEDSINKKQNVFTGTFPDWEFTDCDMSEGTRRINTGKRFLSLYRKFRKS